MELAGRKALLTGATGGLGRAIAEALAARGATPAAQRAASAEALEALAAELPGDGHRVLPADLAEPGAAEKLAAEAGDVDVLVANAGLPGAGPARPTSAPRRSTARCGSTSRRRCCWPARSDPAMVERGSRPPRLRLLALRQGGEPALLHLQRDQVRPARLRPRPARRPRRRSGVGVSLVSPGLHPRRGDVRRLRRQAAARARAPARPSRSAPPSSRRSSANKVEVAVAPLQQRVARPLRARQPRASRRRVARAAAPARRPPTTIAAGHDGQALSRRTGAASRAPLLGWTMSSDSFGARSTLEVGGREYEIFRLDALQERFDVARLPYSLKVLLENVLRLEDGDLGHAPTTSRRSPAGTPTAEPSVEIPFQPARVLMQDFTGVPAVVDLAAMRDAMEEIGGDPAAINPLVDVDLVIDHSVQVDAFGNERAFAVNAERDFERNRERYSFLKWGQQAFDNFRVVPPATGICHQVNLEYLAQVVYSRERDGVAAGLPRHPGRHRLAHDDGQRPRRARLGRRRDRGRGGDARPADLDAAAAGGRLQARRRAARGRDRDRPRPDRDRDAARARRRLQVRRVLRPRACRRSASPTGRRSATCRRSSARPARSSRSTPRRCATSSSPAARPRRSSWSTPTPASRGCSTTSDSEDPTFSDTLELDLGEVVPSIAGPKRPQDRVAARRGQGGLPRGDGGVRPRGRRADGQRPRRGDRGVLPRLRPAGRGPRRRARQAARRRVERRRRWRRRARQRRRDRGHARGRRPSSSSTTAGS